MQVPSHLKFYYFFALCPAVAFSLSGLNLNTNCSEKTSMIAVVSLKRAWSSPDPDTCECGNRAFADVTKMRRGHAGLGWVLNLMTGIFIKRERFEDTEGT